jgi:hypothetical protein
MVVGLLLLLTTPVVASFSMRQVLALATSYSLSIISLMGLLLTLFIAMSLVAKDLEQRHVYTVCSLPISRSAYLLGKFFGFAFLILLAVIILGCFSAVALFVLERIYPTARGFAWGAFVVGLWFQYWVLLIVGAITVLFSTVATSHFLPLALSVGLYFGGYSAEAVRYFIRTAAGQQELGPAVQWFQKPDYLWSGTHCQGTPANPNLCSELSGRSFSLVHLGLQPQGVSLKMRGERGTIDRTSDSKEVL